MKAPCAYLDACIEELLRCSLTEPGSIRTALTDVIILGHRIPKGTDIFLLGNGPGFFSPAFFVDEKSRSPSSRTHPVGEWDPTTMHRFDPTRWLTSTGEFDGQAGPNMVFGLGPRSCFGKKMAYLMMRMFIVMVVWNFELKRCPKSLSGYGASDGVAHHAEQCFVRLSQAAVGLGEPC